MLQSIFKNPDEEEDEVDEEDQRPLEAPPEAAESSTTSSFLLGQNWRDLIPVIKIDLVRFFDNFGVVRYKTKLSQSMIISQGHLFSGCKQSFEPNQKGIIEVAKLYNKHCFKFFEF